MNTPEHTRRYTWLLFDADGTLLDYDASEDSALRTAAASFGLETTSEIREAYREINAALWRELEKGEISSERLRVLRFERLAEYLGVKLDAERFSGVYLEELARSGFMIEGAREMLEDLPKQISKAIITNGIRDTQFGRLKQAGILDDFSHIVVSETAGAAKPSSVFFDYVMERLGDVPRESILVIGDSLSSDIAGGIGYGLDTCWFNPSRSANNGPNRPTYEISRWEDLFAILRA